ncbi:MAG: valine--tRNA ligase [Acholeplasmatales bacterium]|nr:valine--tRNA ligase [Acholeplasmatales bacterium]
MKELKTKYDPKEVEAGKYDFWLKGKFFEAGDNSKQPFTITLPPPNVTGKLHLGHAWDTTIQDMIIRRKRMQGYDALWLPGMDHAGIATQAKVDQRLKEEGISRYDIGREEFLKRAWSWKEEYASIIRSQWAGLGLSLDYSKERFTLDDKSNQAVNYVFITLYNKGYIYQGERIINWDPVARTALSNIEVIHQDDEGAFYYFNYPFTDGSGSVLIATTRPETMFADQAIMVNPTDERFKSIIGKTVTIPGTDITIPVISDEYVDKEFGTGCVKCTPAHDPNDYEVGIRHNLPMPLCMNDDGTMNEMAGKYCGMDRFECRKALIEDLKKDGYFVKEEKIVHSVGHSERTGAVVEPRLSKQWFVKMDVLAKQVLDNKEYRFVPDRFKQTLEHWLTDIQDWCISRQLWWGHRIPAWYKDSEVKVQLECPGDGWVQDEDVLDTWFSSALWPFSTLGFPNYDDPLLKRYYPTNVLVTGYDIIFFWVSRMLFEGIEFMGHAPFNDILIHGLVRDAQGRKMSKSLGNGIDPFDVIDKYGCDSLRYFLNTNTAPGLDLRFDETKIESSWNYLNKIWNISRYVMMNLDGYTEIDLTKANLNMASKWILNRLNKVIKEVDTNFDKYEFGEVARSLYNFVWNDFASWYVEISKVDLSSDDSENKNNTKNVLLYVLTAIIKMLHPFVPFITEEIYQSLPHKKESITIEDWPTVCDAFKFDNEENALNIALDVITAVRNERSKAGKAPKEAITITLVCKEKETVSILEDTRNYLEKFTNPTTLTISCDAPASADNVVVVLDALTIYIPTTDLVDIEEVKQNLLKEKARLEGELTRSEKMLSNPGFVSKAPEAKLQAERQKQAQYKAQYEEVLAHLAKLN